MRTVRLGRSGLQVSEVGFGGIPIVPLPFAEAVAVVLHGADRGLTLFDTAKMYRDSEKKIGQALEPVRDRVVLATKTMSRDAAKVKHDVASSLANLRTDRIDLYQLHNVSSAAFLERVLADDGAYRALAEARAAGTVRAIGVTSHSLETAIRACRTGLFDTVQFPFNFLEQEAAGELFAAARAEDMGIIAMKPLGGGWLDNARLCFGFLQRYPEVVPIPGIARVEELDEIAGLYEAPPTLTEADEAEMERIRQELGPRFCHRCEYCLPCEQGVQIPYALGFPTMVKRFGRETALTLGEKVMESAECCTACGACLERCPYDLPIPELLQENLALYREEVGRGG
ncbi:MAG: aldo/keto reductase [Proteobacteria bacterium]|nr:aldo/keto reductase [Pseudomonadota bacterium]